MQSSPPSIHKLQPGRINTARRSIDRKNTSSILKRHPSIGRTGSGRSMALRRSTAAAVLRVLVATAACVFFLDAGVAEAQRPGGGGGGGRECVPQLNRLLACRAYLVPGAADPSAECCGALSSISRDCACSTMSIINSLPSRCNVGQVNCSA